MNILAIGSHPDDIEYGCGGTLIKFKKTGHNIFLLVMTKGEMGGNPKIRFQEQKKSARLIGAELFWGGVKDTNFPLNKSVINKVEQIIAKVQPGLILVHSFNDTHQDHRKISQATTTATRYIRNVLFYEGPTTTEFSPAVFVDIGETVEEKYSLIKCHHSQVHQTKIPDLTITESVHSCAIFRGFQHRVKYAEGFVPLRLSLFL
ncbi:MAG: PIG-L deacetylase family protein [Elusimicrobiota bacterium]